MAPLRDRPRPGGPPPLPDRAALSEPGMAPDPLAGGTGNLPPEGLDPEEGAEAGDVMLQLAVLLLQVPGLRERILDILTGSGRGTAPTESATPFLDSLGGLAGLGEPQDLPMPPPGRRR